ncbi:hypothetical protein PILCRDRAFT_830038 [Piloderma croceum F 1598]|uniref:DNA2/NAM7 helicase-like C-terminal domain-containing protein n=1 Tax=Piloderma croceum (strain F 1598) TaxID=765440 RepID=A0A0C3EVE0_PILCF|nr:hypothetical protein PILCRDRAFT_830038 [Piloderma croceum F 1598]
MVWLNDAGQFGDLVNGWGRMNVSFTRARSKLIIFGKMLQSASQFFSLLWTSRCR